MTDDSLLESFGDCFGETEVTESSRPVHMPEEEFCERVVVPPSSSCQIKRELVVERKEVSVGPYTKSGKGSQGCNGGVGEWGGCGAMRPSVGSISFAEYFDQFCIGGSSVLRVSWNGAYGQGLTNPSCANGLRASWRVEDASWTGMEFTFDAKVTISANVTRTDIITDRWYPEECISRARRGG